MDRSELKNLVQSSAGVEERGDFVFLHDPQWSAAEKATAQDCINRTEGTDATRGWLCIPTGGTSGQVRFARHDELTLTAAVSGFCLHFGVQAVNAVGVLPLHHVSGLMARVRCAATGGVYLPWDWKRMAAGDYPTLAEPSSDWFLSLVPTQLQRLLEKEEGTDFLKQFRTIFIGGGPTWPELSNAAAALPIALSYGMTETAAMIAAQASESFLAGERDVGRPLPHAQIEIFDDESGRPCKPGITGRIRVRGESVFRGYFPDFQEGRTFETEDLGLWTERGTLCVLGRRDSVIITGGKKVWPLEVETVLRATGVFSDIAVIGVPDSLWGEVIVACYPAPKAPGSLDDVRRALAQALASYKHPKRFVAIDLWPRNEQGKLNRAALRESLR